MNVNAMNTSGLSQSFAPARSTTTARQLSSTDKWLIGIAVVLAIIFYFDLKLLG